MGQRIATTLTVFVFAVCATDCKRDNAATGRARVGADASTTSTAGPPTSMMPPGGMNVSGVYEGSDSTQMSVPGADAGAAERGQGRVDLVDNGATMTVTLIDTDGGAPCVLRAMRVPQPTPRYTTATIAPGQTCSDATPEGNIALTTTAGSIVVAGNSLILNMSANVTMTPAHGGAPANLGMVYNFNGMRH